MSLNNTVRYILIGVVTVAWLFNLAAPVLPFEFLKDYKSDPSINAVFMLIIGALFGADAIDRARGNGDRDQRRSTRSDEDQSIRSSEDGGS